jgi:RNA polymerase-binding transcription factor
MARTMATKGLTKAQLRRFRQMLDDKAEEIRANLRSAAASKALGRGEEPLDEEELPSQSHEEWIFLNRNNIDAMLLREIDEAVVRMNDGSYGTCQECDEAISLKRLEALPWALYCVSCQEALSASEHETVADRFAYRD